MSTAIKHPVPDRVKPSFVIFDIWVLWRSAPHGKSWRQRVNKDMRNVSAKWTGEMIPAVFSLTLYLLWKYDISSRKSIETNTLFWICDSTDRIYGQFAPLPFATYKCHLRSAESGQLTVPRSRTNYGDRSFAVHGPVVWNSLPADLRLLSISLPVFRKRLKMFLFWDNCYCATVDLEHLLRGEVCAL